MCSKSIHGANLWIVKFTDKQKKAQLKNKLRLFIDPSRVKSLKSIQRSMDILPLFYQCQKGVKRYS
jgi:hypothetical protein